MGGMVQTEIAIAGIVYEPTIIALE